MMYAVKNADGEIHIVGSLDGYETWTKLDETDSEMAAPLGVIGDKIVSLEYAEQRKSAYPSVEDQLDMIYHDFDGWKEKIGQIKEQYPKPA